MNTEQNEKKTPQKDDGISSSRLKKIVSIASLVIFVGVMVAVYFFVGKPLIASISDPMAFKEHVQQNWLAGRLFMIGIMALQVVVGIIPGEPMEIGAGYAFGAIEGMVLCLIGAVIGQLIIFVFVRKLGLKLVEAFVSKEKLESIRFFQNSKRLELTTFILYFIPGTPKDMITYVAGLTPINMWRFLAITCVARIPSVISSTIVGGSLGAGQWLTAGIVFAATAVISLIGILVYRKMSKRGAEAEKQEGKDGQEPPPEETGESEALKQSERPKG